MQQDDMNVAAVEEIRVNVRIINLTNAHVTSVTGRQVKQLQGLLNATGATLKVDGMAGDKTKDALIAFKRVQGLGGGAVVDKQTWTALVEG